MIKLEAFRVVHPAGTFMAIIAWNPEHYTDVYYILHQRLGSLATITELTEDEIRDFPAREGHPIITIVAD